MTLRDVGVCRQLSHLSSPFSRDFGKTGTFGYLATCRRHNFHASTQVALSETKEEIKSTKTRGTTFDGAIQSIEHLMEKPLGSFGVLEWKKAVLTIQSVYEKEFKPQPLILQESLTFDQKCLMLDHSQALLLRLAKEHAASNGIGRWWVPRRNMLYNVVDNWKQLHIEQSRQGLDDSSMTTTQKLFSADQMLEYLLDLEQVDSRFHLTLHFVGMVADRLFILGPEDDKQENWGFSDQRYSNFFDLLEERDDGLKTARQSDVTIDNLSAGANEAVLNPGLYHRWMDVFKARGVGKEEYRRTTILKDMLDVVKRMKARLRPNQSTYATMIYEAAGQVQDYGVDEQVIFSVVREMSKDGISVDRRMAHILVQLWVDTTSEGQKAQHLQEAWSELVECGGQPNADAYAFYLETFFAVCKGKDASRKTLESLENEWKDGNISAVQHSGLFHVLLRENMFLSFEGGEEGWKAVSRMEKLIWDRVTSTRVSLSFDAWKIYLTVVTGTNKRNKAQGLQFLRTLPKAYQPDANVLSQYLHSLENKAKPPPISGAAARLQFLLVELPQELELPPLPLELFKAAVNYILNAAPSEEADGSRVIGVLMQILSHMKVGGVLPDKALAEKLLNFCRAKYPSSPVIPQLEETLSSIAMEQDQK